VYVKYIDTGVSLQFVIIVRTHRITILRLPAKFKYIVQLFL